MANKLSSNAQTVLEYLRNQAEACPLLATIRNQTGLDLVRDVSEAIDELRSAGLVDDTGTLSEAINDDSAE